MLRYRPEIAHFTQPDASPAYFINFLDVLDQLPQVTRVRAQAAERMNLSPGMRAIDVGCGIGGATFGLTSLTGPSGLAVGIDISAALINVAVERASQHAGIQFRTSDACAIPYPEVSFDAARSERLFLYLPDRMQAIREMMRVTKPGGRVVLMDTDIDCTAIHSSNPRLARKMTSIIVESLSNPCSGRELPSLARGGRPERLNHGDAGAFDSL